MKAGRKKEDKCFLCYRYIKEEHYSKDNICKLKNDFFDLLMHWKCWLKFYKNNLYY